MPSVTGSGESMGAAARSALQQVSLGRARPSYQARSAAARFRQLNRTEAGRRALSLAGVEPSARTARRWATRQQAPSRRNEAAIARAYRAVRQGGIPEWVKQGRMAITGEIATGNDRRDRTLRVDLSVVDGLGHGPSQTTREDRRGHWEAVEDDWRGLDDDDLEELIAEDLIAESDVGTGSGEWEFPGSGYTVSFSG